MRRHDREVKDMQEIERIIHGADVCRLGLSDDNVPYIVAMNFGYRRGDPPVFYFHCAREGRKLDILRRNSLVCFQLDTDHEILRGEQACGWSMKYRSVTGMGRAEIITEPAGKIEGLNAIMEHYSDGTSFSYGEKDLALTAVIKLTVTEITAKKKGW